VLLLPLGLIGEDSLVEELLTWTRPAGLRLALLREVSPFLASSRMAVVYSAEDGHTPEALKRIRRLFQGNFDFLTLAHQTFTLSHANALHDAQLKTMRAKCSQMEQAVQDWEGQYHEVSERERIAQERALWAESQFTSLTSGTSWALLQMLIKLRLKLFPRESLRERVGRSVMKRQRRLRQVLRRMRTSGRKNHTPRPRSMSAGRARTDPSSMAVHE
jgi:hypothetical protein